MIAAVATAGGSIAAGLFAESTMTGWFVQTLVGTTVLMALALALRRPVARAFGPRIAYALWALPVLRMVLPPLPGHRQLFMPVLRIGAARPADVVIGLVPPDAALDSLVLPDAVTQAPTIAAIGWPTVVVAIWAAGALAFFGWQMLRYHLFVRRALADAELLSVEAGTEVWISGAVGAPVASGIVRRRIFLPADFLGRFTSAERRQALLHEGAHHDRLDILANLIGIATLSAHWFNPIAHLSYRAFRADQELACDATVIDHAAPADRYAYGSALAKAGGMRMPTAACALDNGIEIKRRLRMLKRGRIAVGRRAVGAAMVMLLLGTGLVVTASGSLAAPATLVAPIPPVSPLPPATPAMPAIPAAPAAPVQERSGAARVQTMIVQVPHDEQHGSAASKAGEAERHAREIERQAAEIERQTARSAAARDRQAAALERQAAALRRQADEMARQAGMARRMTDAPDGEYRIVLDRTREAMARRCATAGTPVRAGERDWATLATCDRRIVVSALQDARAEIAVSRDLDAAARDRAVASIDQTIARMQAGPR